MSGKKKSNLFIIYFFYFVTYSSYYFIIFQENKKRTFSVWCIIKIRIRIVRYLQYMISLLLSWNCCTDSALYPKIFLNQIQRVKGREKKKRDEKIFFCVVWNGTKGCLEGARKDSWISKAGIVNFAHISYFVIFHITLTRWTLRISLKSQTMQAFCTVMNPACTPNSIPFHPFPRIITRFILCALSISSKNFSSQMDEFERILYG